MEFCLALCNKVSGVVESLKGIPEVTIKRPSGWKEQMEARRENWESVQEKLFEETLMY